jgi:hypothetical protein
MRAGLQDGSLLGFLGAYIRRSDLGVSNAIRGARVALHGVYSPVGLIE